MVEPTSEEGRALDSISPGTRRERRGRRGSSSSKEEVPGLPWQKECGRSMIAICG